MNDWIEKNYKEQLAKGKVCGFFFEHRFLSNFYECEIFYLDRKFRSTEHVYQAMKSLESEVWDTFADSNLTCSQSRKLGQQIEMRKDWNNIKDQIMYDICKIKFINLSYLKEKLLATNDMYLEETGWWNDRYWGTHFGQGDNRLGKILMQIREELR